LALAGERDHEKALHRENGEGLSVLAQRDAVIAFSSEVDTGSREENASNKKTWIAFAVQRNAKRSS
jgi:hypothetical protein